MPAPGSGWHRKPDNAATAARRQQYASREHRQLRRHIQTQIDAGHPIHCWRCGTRLHGHAWHLGHDDTNRAIYRGAECIPCNLRVAARKGNRLSRRRNTPRIHPRRRRLL